MGFKNGKKLKRYISYKGKKLEVVIRHWNEFNALDENGNIVLDFVDNIGKDVSTDEDRMFVNLNGFSYIDRAGNRDLIERCWYEDDSGNEVTPNTITDEYLSSSIHKSIPHINDSNSIGNQKTIYKFIISCIHGVFCIVSIC